MTIKAIIRDGRIQPLEPLPRDWAEGQELVVREPAAASNGTPTGAGAVDEWAREMEAATGQVPAAEHDRFRRALSDIERESKEAVRREWGLS